MGTQMGLKIIQRSKGEPGLTIRGRDLEKEIVLLSDEVALLYDPDEPDELMSKVEFTSSHTAQIVEEEAEGDDLDTA